MKKLQCDLCGSIDIVKISNDLFQCQHCGCKFTTDEAKRMLFGEVIIRSQDFEIVGGKLVKYHGSSTVVEIPDGVTVVGAESFKCCSGITEVTIPGSVNAIESCAFWGCKSLRDVRIPDSIISLGACCFDGCSSLKNIVIPDSVRILGSDDPKEWLRFSIFRGCTSLESVQLSHNLDLIGHWTFMDCKSLKEIVIPEGVKVIDYCAFRGCDALEKITLPFSLQTIDKQHVTRGGNDWPPSLRSVEGNSTPFFDAFIRYDCLIGGGGTPNYTESWYPIAVVEYAEQIRAERRMNHLCENCGGTIRGLFEKRCSVCGRIWR